MMDVTAGNDGALAAGIALAATIQSFVCTHETSHAGTNMAHRVLNSSTQENVHLTIPSPTKLLLRLTEQLLHVQQMVFVEATFSVKHSVLCKYKHVYYVTSCSTEVGEHAILFFLFFVEESSKRAVREQQKSSLVPTESMLEVTPLVCV